MPLVKSKSAEAFKKNVSAEVKAGKPVKQAVAIAYSTKNSVGKKEGGLWDNIHAKQERIKNGSGERMRKPGSKGAPTAEDFKVSAKKDGGTIIEPFQMKKVGTGGKVKKHKGYASGGAITGQQFQAMQGTVNRYSAPASRSTSSNTVSRPSPAQEPSLYGRSFQAAYDAAKPIAKPMERQAAPVYRPAPRPVEPTPTMGREPPPKVAPVNRPDFTNPPTESVLPGRGQMSYKKGGKANKASKKKPNY